MNKEIIIKELRQKQIDCNNEYKLGDSDLIRISKYIDDTIFGDKCVIWQGFVTDHKVKYINFYFNKKKLALHRILYNNFIGILDKNQYLEFTCPNKGVCCCLKHVKIKNRNIKYKNIKNLNKKEHILYFD